MVGLGQGVRYERGKVSTWRLGAAVLFSKRDRAEDATDRVKQGVGDRLELLFVRVIRCCSHSSVGIVHNLDGRPMWTYV